MRIAALVVAVFAVPALVEPLPLPSAMTPGQGKPVSAEQSPFVGSWKANLSKSKRDPNHQFQSATLHFAVEGDAVTLKHEGVSASGQEESGVTTLHADGKEHSTDRAPGMTVIARWVGSRTLDVVAKKGDDTVNRGQYEVSADGQTLTATVSGIDGHGYEFQQVIVFDRE